MYIYIYIPLVVLKSFQPAEVYPSSLHGASTGKPTLRDTQQLGDVRGAAAAPKGVALQPAPEIRDGAEP